MSTFSTGRASGISKLAREKNQRILLELVSKPGNDTCADCKAKAPRWASHNLGIFICVHCASIHRKIGTHVTKVKSLTLDDWTKEQVENMKAIGNVRANQYWNPDEKKHPLPTNMEESERDSELEKYIRSKYEFQRFRSLSARVAEKLGPSQSLQSRTPLPTSTSQSTATVLPKRSQTAPIHSEPPASARSSQPPVPTAPALASRSISSGSGAPGFGPDIAVPQRRSSFNPFPSSITTASFSQPSSSVSVPPPNQHAFLTESTFKDLISLQVPSSNSSLPLQYAPPQEQQTAFQTQMTTGLTSSPITTFSPASFGSPYATTNPYANLSITPSVTGGPFSSPSPASNFRSTTLPFSSASQAPLAPMPTGAPNAFQQSSLSPSPNSFAQMQMQAQRYPGTQLNPNQSSPFFTPQQQPQPQQPFQHGMSQSPSNTNMPMTTQAQQAQQIFQGMAGGGTGTHNPFAHWGGT